MHQKQPVSLGCLRRGVLCATALALLLVFGRIAAAEDLPVRKPDLPETAGGVRNPISFRQIKNYGGSPEGYIMRDQMEWIERTLEEAKTDPTVKFILLYAQEPVFPCGGHVDDAMWWKGDNNLRAHPQFDLLFAAPDALVDDLAQPIPGDEFTRLENVLEHEEADDPGAPARMSDSLPREAR